MKLRSKSSKDQDLHDDILKSQLNASKSIEDPPMCNIHRSRQSKSKPNRHCNPFADSSENHFRTRNSSRLMKAAQRQKANHRYHYRSHISADRKRPQSFPHLTSRSSSETHVPCRASPARSSFGNHLKLGSDAEEAEDEPISIHKYLTDDEGRRWKHVSMEEGNNRRMRRKYATSRRVAFRDYQDETEEVSLQEWQKEHGFPAQGGCPQQ